jgi:hypothetical protein
VFVASQTHGNETIDKTIDKIKDDIIKNKHGILTHALQALGARRVMTPIDK